MGAAGSPFAVHRGQVVVRVKLTPRAAHERIDGVDRDAAGTAVLKVAVTAPPEKGRANAKLLALLAKTWRLPKSSLAIVAGTTDRRKTVAIMGDPAAELPKLKSWLESLNG